MDESHKQRLVEEAKQSTFGDIVDRAHQGSNQEDAIKLRDEIIKVGIAEAGTLRGLVDKIFDKALTDPEAQRTLAELCTVMPAHFDALEGTAALKEKGAGSRGASEKRIDFRLMLSKKCKEELEKGIVHNKAVKVWENKEAEKELNGDEKRQYEIERNGRERMVQLIAFSGLLYTSGIISEKIIHSCVDVLIKDKEEPRYEDMEALTKLLKVIGSKLDAASKSAKEGKIIAEYYKSMEKMKEEAVSAQVANMLDEVLTLKASGWVEAA